MLKGVPPIISNENPFESNDGVAAVPRVKVPLGRGGGSANARTAALGDDALVPAEVGHGFEQLQAAVARLGGGGLRNVKHPHDRPPQQVVKHPRCQQFPRSPRRWPGGASRKTSLLPRPTRRRLCAEVERAEDPAYR